MLDVPFDMCGVMMQEIKAIIFDCDGTLVDSEETHIIAWQRVFSNWGIELGSQEMFVGKPDRAVARILAEKYRFNADEILTEKRAYFLEAQQKGLPPIEGTVGLVRELVKNRAKLGLKMAVASAADRHEILTNLRALGLEHAFDAIVSGHDDLSDYADPEGVNKPKPYVYLHTAKLLGVATAECIVIEDSEVGIEAGVKAGCITVAIPASSSKHLDLSSATCRFDTLAGFTVEQFIASTMILAAAQKEG